MIAVYMALKNHKIDFLTFIEPTLAVWRTNILLMRYACRFIEAQRGRINSAWCAVMR